MLFERSRSMREKKGEHNKSNDKIKLLMIYIHEHYREKYLFRNLLRQHI